MQLAYRSCISARVRCLVGFRSKRAEQAEFIGEKVDYLFRTVRKPTGEQYTNEEVHQATGISAPYLSRLRKKKVSNPGRDVLEALSIFFRVGPEYWFRSGTYITPSEEQQAQVAVIHRKLDEGNYTPEQVRFIAQMLEHLRELTEGTEQAKTSPTNSDEGEEHERS